jgi:hypothetical protein
VENNDVGEHEDDDVRTERQKVSDILSNRSADPPVVVVQVICTSVTDFGIMMFQNPGLFFVLLNLSESPQKPSPFVSLVFILCFAAWIYDSVLFPISFLHLIC